MKNFILKSGVASLAMATLVASGTTTPDKVDIGYTSLLSTDKIATAETKLNVAKTAEGEIELTIGDKKYSFNKADLEDPSDDNPYRYNKKISDDGDINDIRIELRNKYHKGVQMWEVSIARDNGYEQGFLITGDKPVKMPTDIVATYNGGFSGNVRNKTDPHNGDSNMFGDIKLEADFKNSVIKGNFYDVKTWDNEAQTDVKLDGGADITAGIIDGDKFTATLTTDAALNASAGLSQSLTGQMNGGFYGYYGNEIAGTALIGNDKYTGLFGFDATKEYKN